MYGDMVVWGSKVSGLGFRVFDGLPVGSYHTSFLGYLLFYTPDPNRKARYPKKGVGYEPLGRVDFRSSWA